MMILVNVKINFHQYFPKVVVLNHMNSILLSANQRELSSVDFFSSSLQILFVKFSKANQNQMIRKDITDMSH